MTNFNLPKPCLLQTSLPYPLTSSQPPFPGGSSWRSLRQGPLSTRKGKPCIAHRGLVFSSFWKSPPTSFHVPYKLLRSKTRNLTFVPDDPTGQSTLSQQEKVLGRLGAALSAPIARRGLNLLEKPDDIAPCNFLRGLKGCRLST